jgi:hypothetical protein
MLAWHSVVIFDSWQLSQNLCDTATGLIGGFRKTIANEGMGAVWTGFGPTAAGYFLQGAFKFGGYEFFKQQWINQLGLETASNLVGNDLTETADHTTVVGDGVKLDSGLDAAGRKKSTSATGF